MTRPLTLPAGRSEASPYLLLPRRTLAQAKLDQLNAEFIRRAEWRRTPEGIAYTEMCERQRAEENERQLDRLADWFIARMAP